jgi:hypothetical protein
MLAVSVRRLTVHNIGACPIPLCFFRTSVIYVTQSRRGLAQPSFSSLLSPAVAHLTHSTLIHQALNPKLRQLQLSSRLSVAAAFAAD